MRTTWPIASFSPFAPARLPLAALAAALISAGCGADAGAGGGSGTGGTGSTGAPALPAAQESKAPDTLALANELVGLFANDGAAGAKFAADSQAVDQVAGGCDSPTDPGGVPVPGGEPGNEPSDGCEGFDAEDSAKEIQDWFKDSLFDEKFVDTKLSTAKAIVVCVAAADFCDSDYDDQGNETLDAKCAEGLAKTPLCLAITWHGGKLLSGAVVVGLDMAIKPATFQLTPDLFHVEVDLAEVSKGAKALAAATGEELPEEFPTTMVGKIAASLARSNGKMLTGTVSVANKVHVAAFALGDKRFYDVQIAAAKDALKLVLGQADSTIVGGVKLGAIDVQVATDLLFGSNADCGEGESVPGGSGGEPKPGGDPGSDCGEPAKPLTGALVAKLPGVTFDATFTVAPDGKHDTFKLTGLGLGASSATAALHDGGKVHPLGSVDLNADAGRKVDLSVIFDGKTATLTTLPKLLVHVVHTLAPLALQLDDIPKFLHAGSSTISFDGDAKPTFAWGGFGDDAPIGKEPTPILPGGDGSGGGKDGGGDGSGSPDVEPEGNDFPPMEVVLGLLTLKAAGIPVPPADVLVQVKAGLCLGEAEGGDKGGAPGTGGDGEKEEPGHFFSQLAAVACK